MQERDYDEPYVSRPSRNLTSADIPSLAALRQMREDTGREPDDFRAPPARENEPDAAAKRRSQERREDRFPTVEQLRAQREEEQRYGNRAFQESVRQIKHAPNDPAQDAGAQREAARQKAPEPQRGEADRRADAPPKVHYIPYEDFLKNESFEDLTPAGKNGEAGPARVAGKNPQKNDAAEGNAYRRPPQRARRDPYADGARPNGYPDWADGRPYPAPGAPEAADYPQERPKGKIAGKVKKNARKKKTTDSGDSFLGQLPTADQLKKSKPKFGHRKAAVTGEMPSDKQLTKERSRLRYKSDFLRVLRNTLFTLITVSAIAVLIAVLLLPVLRIYGTSMTPTLDEGNIVISVKGGKFDTGDVVAFYYNNKILVKRVIAQAGDWVDIAKDGTVSVNGVVLDEPYVQSKAFGECDIELPYQVPEDRVFVMGDYRDVSIDSRNTSIGPIAKEQIVGRIVYRIWPFDSFGSFE